MKKDTASCSSSSRRDGTTNGSVKNKQGTVVTTMLLWHLLVANTHGFVLLPPLSTEQLRYVIATTGTSTTTTTSLQAREGGDGPWWSEYMEVSDGAVSNKGAPDPFERMRQRPPRTNDPNARAVNFGPDFDGSTTPSSPSRGGGGYDSYREESDTAYRAAVTKSNNVPSGDGNNNIPSSFRAEEQDSSKWSSFMTVSDGPDPVPDPVQRQYQEELDKQRQRERQQFEEEWKQQFPNQPVPPPPPSSSSSDNTNSQQQSKSQTGPLPNKPDASTAYSNNNNQQQQQQPPYPQPPYAQQFPYMDPTQQQQQYPYPNSMDPYAQPPQQNNNYWMQDPFAAAQQQQQNPFAQPPGAFLQNPYQQQPPPPYTPGPYINPPPPQAGMSNKDSGQSVVQQRMQEEMAKFEREQKGSSTSSTSSSPEPNGLWTPGTESSSPPPAETSGSGSWAQYMSVSDGPEPTEYYAKPKPEPREQYGPPQVEEQEEEPQEEYVAAWAPDRPQSLWEGQTPPPSFQQPPPYGGNNNNNNQDPWIAQQQQQQQLWQAEQQRLMEQAMQQQRAMDQERRKAHMSVDNSPQAWEQAHSQARERQQQAEHVAQLKAERARQEETLRELEKARAIARYRVLRTRLELERRVQAEEAARARAMAKIEVDERARRRASRDNAEELARREAEEKAIREADRKIRQERERLQAEELSKAESAAKEWEAAVARARAKILAEEIVKRERAKKAEQEKKGDKPEEEVDPSALDKEEKAARRPDSDRLPSVRNASDWKAKKSEVFNGARELYEEDDERPKSLEEIDDQSVSKDNDDGSEDNDDDFVASSISEARKTTRSTKKSTEGKPASTTQNKSQPSAAQSAAKQNSGPQSVVKQIDSPLVASGAKKKSKSPSKMDQPVVEATPDTPSTADTQRPTKVETKLDEQQSSSKEEYFANRIEESRKRALLASIQAAMENKDSDSLQRIHDLIDSVEQEAKKATDKAKTPISDRRKHFANRIEESRQRAIQTSQKSKPHSPTRQQNSPSPADMKESDPEERTTTQETPDFESSSNSALKSQTKQRTQQGSVDEIEKVPSVGMTESRRRSLLDSIRKAKTNDTPLRSIHPSKVGNSTASLENVMGQQGSKDAGANGGVGSGTKSTNAAKKPAGNDKLKSSPVSSSENVTASEAVGSRQKTFLQALGKRNNGKAGVSDNRDIKEKNAKTNGLRKAAAKRGKKGVVERRQERTPKKR